MFAASWATIACLPASSGSQPAAAQYYIVPTPGISVLSSSFEVAVSTVAPTAGVTEGLSTRDAIILGVVLGVAVVLAAILSVILVLRSRRISRRPTSANSNPTVDKQPKALPEASPDRPLSEGQSHLYEYVDEACSRGPTRSSPGESAWPETALPLRKQALTGSPAGSRPPPPLPQDAGRASATPATDNYYIRLINE